MSHTLLNGRIAVACSFMFTVAASCPGSDSSGLDGIVTYDVTTTLDSFSFETAAPSPPDCPNFTMYCTHFRAFSGAELSGTLVFDPSAATSIDLAPTGTFEGKFCDAIDYKDLTGCTHVAVQPPTAYGVGFWPPMSPGSPFNGKVGSSAAVTFSGMNAGDSVYGRVSWIQNAGRSPPTHRGTFVARRRK